MRVSICLIAYNHGKYIRQSLESIVSQETSFAYRVIIGEDCSTDDTRMICEDFAKRFPDKIYLIPEEKNLGMMKNFLRTYHACDGDYIAFTEGDDYWTDNKKLQKQVDFLEANPGYAACFHNSLMKMERNNENREWVLHTALQKDSFETEDILGPWFVPSCAMVFVNYPDFVLPPWFANCKYGDLPFMLLLSLKGKFKYIDEIMCVYRLHDNGLSNVHKAYDKITLMIYIYESFNIHTAYKFQETIKKSIIYEIDRHIPKTTPIQIIETNTGAFNRAYRKIRKNFARMFA